MRARKAVRRLQAKRRPPRALITTRAWFTAGHRKTPIHARAARATKR
jgi:hypothetical protein